MELLSKGLVWYVVFILSTAFHEAAHAFTAMKRGDDTAYENGQVTINPIPHIRREPLGTVVVPILSFLMSGWMIGWASTPYDYHWALGYPKRWALMFLSGPLSNLLLVIVSALIIRSGILLDLLSAPSRMNFSYIVEATDKGFLSSLCVFISITFSINLLLFVFNLIPVPPLDGSGLIPLCLDEQKARGYMEFIRNPSFGFFGLFAAWKMFDIVFHPIHLLSTNLLYPGLRYH